MDAYVLNQIYSNLPQMKEFEGYDQSKFIKALNSQELQQDFK